MKKLVIIPTIAVFLLSACTGSRNPEPPSLAFPPPEVTIAPVASEPPGQPPVARAPQGWVITDISPAQTALPAAPRGTGSAGDQFMAYAKWEQAAAEILAEQLTRLDATSWTQAGSHLLTVRSVPSPTGFYRWVTLGPIPVNRGMMIKYRHWIQWSDDGTNWHLQEIGTRELEGSVDQVALVHEPGETFLIADVTGDPYGNWAKAIAIWSLTETASQWEPTGKPLGHLADTARMGGLQVEVRDNALVIKPAAVMPEAEIRFETANASLQIAVCSRGENETDRCETLHWSGGDLVW